MFYCQREQNPVWIVANPKGELFDEPRIKSNNEIMMSIELLYEKYQPQFENLLYESFYNFVQEVIAKGVCNSSIERIFSMISEVNEYRLKTIVKAHMVEVAELLADEEGEDASFVR